MAEFRGHAAGGPDRYDAVVVGSGPNGLAAALTLAREGLSVCVIEAEAALGGGVRSAELTLPGFVHDLCSAVHPLAVGSPFFRSLALSSDELWWVHPPIPFAHPLDDGPAARVERSVTATAAALGRDGNAYRRLLGPFAGSWDDIAGDVLAPPGVPERPALVLRFGLEALRSAASLARRFETEPARALIAGVAAHVGRPLERMLTGGAGLLLTLLAHDVGWPIPRGGAQRITDALAARLRSLGGRVVAGFRIRALGDLPPARAVLFDVTPRQLIAIAGDALPGPYRRRLARFRYGSGVFKLDWALAEPIPWRDSACEGAGTLHLGGTFSEIAAAERDVARGLVPGRPYVLVSQPSRFDPTRAPAGRHVAWGYCHVPFGADVDMTEAVERQIERFAPGFRDIVLARSAMGPADLERIDANHIGGSIDGGVHDLRQTFARPVPSLDPYATPVPGLFLCSSSTSPGSGVHGMCGFLAARSALRRVFGAK